MTSPRAAAGVRVDPQDPDHLTGLHDGSRAVASMVTGPLLYALLGWAVDHFWLHTGILPAIGLLVGSVLSGFMIYRRYKDLR